MEQPEPQPGQAQEPDAFGEGVDAASDVVGETNACPQCGATVSFEQGDPAQCPQCGASVPHTPVTKDTEAPAPG